MRVVGRTPKLDHYTYEIVLDFAEGSERVSAKVYRAGKCGAARRRSWQKLRPKICGSRSTLPRRADSKACPVLSATSPSLGASRQYQG